MDNIKSIIFNIIDFLTPIIYIFFSLKNITLLYTIIDNYFSDLVDLLTAIVDTDYDNWAVFVQCSNEESQLK